MASRGPLSLASLLTASSAQAQVHWDVGAQVGATKRFTTGTAPSRDAGAGAEIQCARRASPDAPHRAVRGLRLSPNRDVPARRVYAARGST